jgi:hypothetical protein
MVVKIVPNFTLMLILLKILMIANLEMVALCSSTKVQFARLARRNLAQLVPQ